MPDTNVVQAIQTFGEYIFENHLDRPAAKRLYSNGPNYVDEVESLACFLTPVTRTPVRFIESPLTLFEFSRTRNPVKRRRLLDYADKLLVHGLDNLPPGASLGSLSPSQARLSDFRTGVSDPLSQLDRFLFTESRRARCQAFLTMDHKAMKHLRSSREGRGLRVICPAQYWQLLRPWYRLYA